MWSEFLNKTPKEEQSDTVKNREKSYMIENLKEPASKILRAISSDIENGNYDLIIGDDASGRLPTLLFSNIIKAAYNERGYALPKVRFVAGGRHLGGDRKTAKKKLLSDYLMPLLPEENEGGSVDVGIRIKDALTQTEEGTPLLLQLKEENKKVLVVTDCVFSGKSLDPLIETLQEGGIDFDVVAISSLIDPDLEWKNKLISGGEGGVPEVYGSLASGVKKNVDDLFAELKKAKKEDEGEFGYDGERLSEFNKTVKKEVKESREDVDSLSKEIFLKWREEHPLLP